MAASSVTQLTPGNHRYASLIPSLPTRPPSALLLSSSAFLSSSSSSSLSSSLASSRSLRVEFKTYWKRNPKPKALRVDCSAKEPLKVMISGAPASGKGTQCQMIVEKYGLVHISTGDLLRAEVSQGTEIGKKAKEYMDNGMLVPDDIVTDMVISRLSQHDVKEKGWLLDGFPRNPSQAQSLERIKIRPDIYIVLDVPDEILIDRCVGRRLDPVTGKIYHRKYFRPETEEVSARLITRSDDTQEKVKSRLETHKRNAEATLPTYLDLLKKVDGNRSKEIVFEEIDSLLQQVYNAVNNKNLDKIKGRYLTTFFMVYYLLLDWKTGYQSENDSFKQGLTDLPDSQVEINIPELNPEMDVYRIGTLMELVRTLALSFADDGKHVKVCVQGSMGEGALAGMPLQLAGSRKILEFMDWGDHGAKGTFINIGSIGAREVDEQDDIFILVAPQNAVGNCIIDDLKAMTDAAGNRPVILVNPRLKIQLRSCYENFEEFEILIVKIYVILGFAGIEWHNASKMTYPYRYELFKRVDEPSGKEKYVVIATFPEKPTGDEINDAFQGKPSVNFFDLDMIAETRRKLHLDSGTSRDCEKSVGGGLGNMGNKGDGVFPSVGGGEGTRGGTVENMRLKVAVIPSDEGTSGKEWQPCWEMVMMKKEVVLETCEGKAPSVIIFWGAGEGTGGGKE
ncbi:putative adenylate kinase 5, chloroplastic [Cocos nucifera]|uniref:adenylate kinase n=1 Tax=Cocos nucifera TaxID=13894 RepID=A0A8K0N9M5_COCNU|nr:putative adenylate kinase 5, chloroplastic [Cocos nucifera]